MKTIAINLILFITSIASPPVSLGASDSKHEFESLFPMYFFGGQHLAAGVRFEQWRFRASCIEGGRYEYEPESDDFERNLATGCGVVVGYSSPPTCIPIYLLKSRII